MSQPTLQRRDPSSGVGYGGVLTGPGQEPVLNLLGVLIALTGFTILVPLVSQLLLRLLALARGQHDFGAYQAAARNYELPDGLVATNLALATLTIVAFAVFRQLHGRHPHWLVSVQPGLRGRYLLICVLLALVVLNATVWASFLLLDRPAFSQPQDGWWWFALAVLICSPLQAAAEEFFFRGYLLQAIGGATGSALLGLVGQALLFALFHGAQNPALFAHRLAFGLIMGLLVLRTGGLEAPIAAHVVNNVCAFGYALVTGGVAALKATTAIEPARAAFDIAGFALLALAAWWVGRRLQVATVTP